MIVLVVLFERFIFRDNRDFAGIIAASWRFKDGHTAPRAKGCDILCFGDSFVQFGVIPRVIHDRTGRRAYNFAVQSGSSASSYFLLRRAIESGARPSLVVADFAQDILADGPASKTRPYPWADLLQPGEMIELSFAARDPELLARYALGRILPSFRGRFEVRVSILSALEGSENPQRHLNLPLLRNWSQNAGAQVIGKNPSFRDPPAPPAEPTKPGNWRPDPTNALYLEKFLELAARQGITVAWLLPPWSPGVQAIRDHSGDGVLFDRFIRATGARHPSLVIIDARRSGFPRRFVRGRRHLDRDGALALSADIADFLHTHPKPAETSSRLVMLPSYQFRAIKVPVEDVAQSTAMVQARIRLR